MVWHGWKDCRTFGDLFWIIFCGSVSLFNMHLLIRFNAKLWEINGEGKNLKTKVQSYTLEWGQRAGKLAGECLQHAAHWYRFEKRTFFMKNSKSHLWSYGGSKAQVLQGIRLPVRMIFQNKGSWLLQSQKYSGSKAGVSVAEADSKEEACLGALITLNLFFLWLCKNSERSVPLV